MTLTSGTRLGPYEILAPIGAGGMGEVYKARDSKLNRDVAVKVLPESLARDPDALARFEREAHAVAALNHPNILSIHDFGTSDGIAYAVMELLEGENLRSRLEGAVLPQRRAVEIAIQIAHGLAAAHEKGIIHRDLKPENVFLTADGRVKILDFGLAKKLGIEAAGTNAPTTPAETEPGTVMGTVGYMSPEQVRGRELDPRTDIFSFGAILYEMLSGRRAFKGDSGVETMNAILKEEPPELLESGRNISAALDRIVRHCLEKSPEARFHSAGDVAFDLEAVSGSSASVSGTPSGGRKRRSWLPVALLLSLLALPAAYFLGAQAQKNDQMRFKVFTFRRGTIRSARFAPDGHTIVYGAAWQGTPIHLFSATVEHLESAPIALPDADIFAINAGGEILISLGRRYLSTHHSIGTLASAPVSGGAPHEILENVQAADFGPDGKSIAVIRDVEGKNRLEYPLGTVLCETLGWMSHVRVSPRGDLLAFFDHPDRWDNRGTVAVVDLKGHKKTLTPIYNSEEGLAWSPSGDEVWYSSGYGLGGDSVRAVTPNGKQRVVYQGVGDLAIFDVTRDGKALVSRALNQREMMFGQSADARERNLSWFDWSYPIDMVASGRRILFSESGLGAGTSYSVFVRETDGSPAIRVGEGNPESLSPDGKFVIVHTLTSPSETVLLPTGAGEPKTLHFGNVQGDQVNFFPDNHRLLLEGHEPGRGSRLYVSDVDGSPPRAISGEGVRIDGDNPISVDGKFVAATGPDGKAYVYSVESGAPRLIPGLSGDDEISRWSPDGASLYVFRHGELPAKVVRLSLATGNREPWKEVMPSDPSGVVTITPILFTPDGKTYAYSYPRILSQLFLGEGLK